jgi:metallo-beta-lactamase family protein
MQINFLGPIDRVAGSCYWLKDEKLDVEFLVDCGIKQGGAREENNEWNRGKAFPFDPAGLDFVVLTHAHIDHCGMVPYLYKEGFDGPVHCTVETARLAKLMLRDSASRDETPFDRSDVNLVHWDTALETSHGPFNHPFPVAEDVFVDFCRNGHILGSVSASIKWGPPKTEEQKSIRFSGDIGPSLEDEPLHPFLRFRMRDFQADYVVMESTYGDRPATATRCASTAGWQN